MRLITAPGAEIVSHMDDYSMKTLKNRAILPIKNVRCRDAILAQGARSTCIRFA